MKFKYAVRNWVEYRKLLPDMVECDFHWMNEKSSGAYYENMQAVWDKALRTLVESQVSGKKFVMFTHGGSTSRIGSTTSRSQVRKLMRSKDATPYIVRSECIEQDTVFVAAIRPLKSAVAISSHTEPVTQEPIPALVPTGQSTSQISSQSLVTTEPRREHVCKVCGCAVNKYVAKLCLFSLRSRFGGSIYCMDCQNKIR